MVPVDATRANIINFASPGERRRSITIRTASALLLIAASVCAPAPPPADLVFRDGPVYTLNPEAPWTEGLAVRGGKIIALEDVDAFIGDDTTVVDLDGRLLLPGFRDDSVDLDAGGEWLTRMGIDLDSMQYIHRFGITSISGKQPARFRSHWPQSTVDPLVAIHTAATGLDLDGRSVSAERLSIEDALAAYASGLLEIGESANLAVISRNLLKIPATRIAESKVEMTVVRGEIVYAAATFDRDWRTKVE